MKILVTAKRCVDPDVKVKLTDDGSLDQSNVEYKLNPFDEYGVEEAVKLKENGDADEVVVVSVGTQDAQKEIRTALAMGADRGILVEVDEDEDLDPLTIAKLLAGVVEDEEPDMVLMGKLAVDAENNQVGQMLAQLCDMGQGTFAYSLEIDGDHAVVGREVDGGTSDVKVKLPAIITADLRLNEPRYASLPGIMKAKKKQLDTVTPDDLDVEIDAQVRVIGFELPPEREAGEIVEDVDELLDKLRNDAKVID
jgi:electron transfer flavoprotein beta subunit